MQDNTTSGVPHDPFPHIPDLLEIQAGLEAIMLPGGVHEICAIRRDRHTGACKPQIDTGYADSPVKAAQLAAQYNFRSAQGVYVGLNPVDPALLSRYCNRIQEGAKDRTKDEDIVCFRNLLLDVDPVRKKGISATAGELAAAVTITTKVEAYLTAEGWPAPVISGTSGNGGHLVYRLPDLPNNGESTALVRQILVSLARLFNTDAVTIDTGVFNASRITKIPGTFACKGDHTKDRPWRKAQAVCRG